MVTFLVVHSCALLSGGCSKHKIVNYISANVLLIAYTEFKNVNKFIIESFIKGSR